MKPLDVGVNLYPLAGSCSYYKTVSFGQVDSALDSNPGPGFFCWWVEPLGVGVKLCPGAGSCS